VVSNIAVARSAGTLSAGSGSTGLSSISDPNNTGFAHITDATSSAASANPTMKWTWTSSSPYALTTVVISAATAKKKGQVIQGAIIHPAVTSAALE